DPAPWGVGEPRWSQAEISLRRPMRFRAALYARVSTEDRQSPADSIAWQRSIAAALIAPHGGQIVAEYLDVGVSRSLPWSRRPEAARLLADCARKDRGFDALV